MRPITIDKHPDNICVFTAGSMMEALLKADTARRDGYKAGIWTNPGKAMARQQNHILSPDFIARQSPDLQPHFQRAAKLELQFARESYKMPAPGLDPEIERNRFSALSLLRVAFRKVIPEGRCQMISDYAPHTDEEPYPEKSAQPENLFNGQNVKILCPHNVAGFYVFDQRDNHLFDQMGSAAFTDKIRPKWFVNLHDVGFFQGGFLHSAAKFKLAEGQTPRAIDIQDCSGGIPLKLALQIKEYNFK